MCTTQPIRDINQLKKFKNYYLLERPNPRNYLLIIVGLNTALRISDILHLNYGDVYDFEKQNWNTHIVVKEQKTGKINRIYVNQEVHNALELCTDCLKGTPNNWLFSSQLQSSEPLSRYQAYRIIREAACHAGLGKDISCHSLRKTFGYHAWKQGTPPALLMKIYNHSNYEITQRYLCIDQDDKDSVYENIKF